MSSEADAGDTFSDALRARLAANEALATQREAAEAELDRILEEQQQASEELDDARRARHAMLSSALQELAGQLKAMQPDRFIVRSGWTASGEEFVAKLTTRQMRPKRSLFVELDRDDDEVLARWSSDLGNAVEIWRLLEFDREMLTELVLQVADDQAWTGRRPPRFPGAAPPEA